MKRRSAKATATMVKMTLKATEVAYFAGVMGNDGGVGGKGPGLDVVDAGVVVVSGNVQM